MEAWHAWIRRRLRVDPRTMVERPMTTGWVPFAIASYLMPSVASIGWSVTKTAATQVLNASARSLFLQNQGSLVSAILSVPTHLFFSSPHPPSEKAKELLAIATHDSDLGSLLKTLTESRRSIALFLCAVTTLFLEYFGMTAMQTETRQNAHALPSQDSLSLTTQIKKTIHTRYQRSPYYQRKDANRILDLKDVDAVRAAYNILVGVNQVLFAVGGTSTDPSAEIVHWSAILLYWEVLSRLLHLYGWAPLSAASRLLLSNLTTAQKPAI